MSGMRDELKEMSRGFRWGRRPLTPRSAEPFAEERDDAGFPTDWARTEAGTAARQAILNGVMHPLLRNELALRVHGLDNLQGVDGPVLFYSNHSSHLDATLIMTTLPDAWQAKTAVGAARDYFFDVWWRQAFTALVYGAFPIDRSKGGRGAVDKARELIEEGWSIVVFPEGTRSLTGELLPFKNAPFGLAIAAQVPVVPIYVDGTYRILRKGGLRLRSMPIHVRIGEPIPTAGLTAHDRDGLRDRVWAAISELKARVDAAGPAR